jgi:hypothetical protein
MRKRDTSLGILPMLLNPIPPRLCRHQRLEFGLEHRHAEHCPLGAAHDYGSQWAVIPGGTWLECNHSLRVPLSTSTRLKNRRAM